MGATYRRVAAVALIAVSVTAWADEADDNRKRDSLKEEITRHLEQMASALRGVAGSSSGESSIEQTRSDADSVKSKAGALRDIARSDSTASGMASSYPSIADRYREAASYLKQMRAGQQALDGLPKLCEDQTSALEAGIRRYVDRNDPAGTEALPKLGIELGRPIAERLTDADRRRGEMQSWRDRAKNFSDSDGKWSDVRSNLKDSADQVYEHFNRAWESSRKTCNDLNKQDRHPAIEQAVKLLGHGEKGRQDLYQELDRKLGEIARALTDADVDRATNLAGDLQSSIDRLAQVKGEDRKAGEMASSWPRYNSAYRETVKHLRIMKERQGKLDPAPERCARMKTALDGVIRQFDKDPNGIDDIQKLAGEHATALAAMFREAAEDHSKLQSARSAIGGFSISDGKWREVAEAMKRTTEAIAAYWQAADRKAHDACDALALGDKNPLVLQAIKALTDHAGGAIESYQREVAAWRERVRVYKRRDCDEMNQLWEALCGPLDYEPNEDEDKATAWALSDQIVRGLLPGVADLLKEYDAIKKQGEELQKKARTKDEATRILASLVEDHTKLTKLQTKSGWTGTNSPLVQFYISYGVQQHKVMSDNSSYSCDAKDVTFGNNRKRPDCVSGSHCMIFEFKPNNPKAIDAGKSQLTGYVKDATAYYQDLLDNRRVADSDRGGTEIMRKLAGKCLDSNNKIKLEGKVEPYERCERRYECVQ